MAFSSTDVKGSHNDRLECFGVGKMSYLSDLGRGNLQGKRPGEDVRGQRPRGNLPCPISQP